jgi:hypothetical protein
MKKNKGFRRWHVQNSETHYVHGGFSNKSYAIKIARGLSESMHVYVVDKLSNAIVWGR